jgi:hypothetical protein
MGLQAGVECEGGKSHPSVSFGPYAFVVVDSSSCEEEIKKLVDCY